METVNFAGYECRLRFNRYASADQIAIDLITDANGYPEPVATATICLPEIDLAPGEVIIKDYSENEGMLDALVEGGIVSPPERFVETLFMQVPVCRLLVEPEARPGAGEGPAPA